MMPQPPSKSFMWTIRLTAWFVCFSFISSLDSILAPVQAAPKIIDYQKHLPRKFKKRRRKATDYIIVHSTESGLTSALRSLARGGHANYLIAHNGTIYRILNKDFRANHAGRSMWKRREDISSYSIGIELVGYHNDPFTEAQYSSLKWLIEVFQKQYKIPDWDVLEHYRVAYGKPNRYVKKPHRGRKKDPGIFNFSRSLAGLTSKDSRNNVLYDPDVDAARLIPDPDIDVARLEQTDKKKYAASVAVLSENIITAENSAWRIAREDYDSPNTVYRFPNGTVKRGHEITDWERIPAGTRLYMNREEVEEVEAITADVPIIKKGLTAFDIAGTAYKRADTYYIFPKGTIKHGKQIRLWSRIPSGTRVLINYNKPVPLTDANLNTAQNPETVFLIPKNQVLAAVQVPDVSSLESGTLIFVKK